MSRVRNAVRFVARSGNAKLGRCAATWVSQDSCPLDCPHLKESCYAKAGRAGITTRRLNRAGRFKPATLAREEARQIQAAPGDRPLRVHVVGDSPDDESARIVGAAMAGYTRRSGQPSWTYTHAWRVVKRSSWGAANVLASCETVEAVKAAHRAGYATALVMSKFASEKTHDVGGIKVIPCPAQTRGTTCDKCRLCWNAPRLRKAKLTIGFAVHGVVAQKVDRDQPGRIALEVV